MIPAEGYIAHFKDESTGGHTSEHVVAWDEEGYALIVSPKAGRLVRASDQLGFERLDTNLHGSHLVPGGGWMATTGKGTESRTVAVVAWRIGPEGYGEPLFLDDDDFGVTPLTDWHRVWHPDQKKLAASDEADHRQPPTATGS